MVEVKLLKISVKLFDLVAFQDQARLFDGRRGAFLRLVKLYRSSSLFEARASL